MVVNCGYQAGGIAMQQTGSFEDATREIAEKIRSAVENPAIGHDGNSIARHISISLGISTPVPPQTTNFISLMQSADKALYRAKKTVVMQWYPDEFLASVCIFTKTSSIHL